jgi:hypothetical protein
MAKLSKADQGAQDSLYKSRKLKESCLAQLRQLELRERKGELIQTSAVRAVWSEHHARVRDRALALPDRLAESLANQPASVVREKLVAEIEDLLRNCAENVI